MNSVNLNNVHNHGFWKLRYGGRRNNYKVSQVIMQKTCNLKQKNVLGLMTNDYKFNKKRS